MTYSDLLIVQAKQFLEVYSHTERFKLNRTYIDEEMVEVPAIYPIHEDDRLYREIKFTIESCDMHRVSRISARLSGFISPEHFEFTELLNHGRDYTIRYFFSDYLPRLKKVIKEHYA